MVHLSKIATIISLRGIVCNALTTKEQYIVQYIRGVYVASVCQPEASFNLSFATQVINSKKKDVTALNK